MIRNLKTLGLAIVAALALGAMSASAASASIIGGEFTAMEGNYPVHVEGADRPGTVNALTGALGIECAEATYTGELTAGSSTLDLTPTFHNCTTSANDPVTITHNGCKYRIHVGTGTGGTPADWHGTAALVCPSPEPIEVHVYAGPGHTNQSCELEIPAQSNLPGVTLTDETENSIVIEGLVTGITNYAQGPCVGGPTTQLPNAALHLNATVEGTNEEIHIGTTG